MRCPILVLHHLPTTYKQQKCKQGIGITSSEFKISKIQDPKFIKVMKYMLYKWKDVPMVNSTVHIHASYPSLPFSCPMSRPT